MNSNYKRDYFYVNEKEVKKIQEQEILRGNPFTYGGMINIQCLIKFCNIKLIK